VKRPVLLISAITLVLILTTGCFGGGESEATAAPTTEQAQASEPTAAAAASTEAAPAAETPATEAAAGESSAAALTVEEVAEITSYRMRVLIVSQANGVTDTIRVEGAYIKEPPAEQIEINFQEGDQVQQVQTMLVDGLRYTSLGDAWTQTPDSGINIGELTLMTPKNVAGVLGQMEVVGTETVNGLSAVHYRGSKEIIPVVGPEGDSLDVSQVEAAQLDLWVDETYHAIISLKLTATNTVSDKPIDFTLTYDYLDLNTTIQIVAPETMAESSTPPADDFVPKNELQEMLGFNIMFPVDSTIETVSGTNLYVIVVPYTREEAKRFVESAMQSNGYSVLSSSDLDSGETIYLYQKENKVYTVTLSDVDGKTRFQFATG
jgi:hypothetical protein